MAVMRRLAAAAAAVLVFAALGSGAARADMEVLESNVPSIKVGSRLPDATKLELPPGGRVLVMLADKKTREFKGPEAGSKNPFGGTRGKVKSE